MLEYFAAEKRESLLFIVIGMIAIAAGVTLFRTGSVFRGAAYPFIAIAIIQIVVGSTVYFRTDGQVEALRTQLASNPVDFRTDEIARMIRVMSGFQLYKIIEIALIVAAVILLAVFRPPSAAVGVAVGLLLQSSVMLVADVVAERRGQVYLDAVSKLIAT